MSLKEKSHITPILRLIAIFYFTGLAFDHSLAQSPETTIRFFTADFSFSITQPAGWKTDSTHAKKYDADLVFYQESEGLGKDRPMIRIKAMKWESSSPSMDQDPRYYRKRDDIWKSQHYDDAHKDYTYQPIMLSSKDGNETTDIMNINPGSGSAWFFVVSLVTSGSSSAASNAYAMRTIVISFTFIKE